MSAYTDIIERDLHDLGLTADPVVSENSNARPAQDLQHRADPPQSGA